MILLDTHVLIWLRLESDKLGPKSRQLIDQCWQMKQVYVSAISFWEIAMLTKKGRLKLSQDIGVWHNEVLGQGLGEIPVSSQISIKAGGLDGLPGDPADRIIVATALDGYQLITADQKILEWQDSLSKLNART